MTSSHWLGIITFGVSAFFAALAWMVSDWHPETAQNPAARLRTRWTAVFLLLFGAGLGYYAFSVDNQMRVTTLYESMIEGGKWENPTTPGPTRTISFTVEHPGVAHELFLAPTSELFEQPKGDAEAVLSLRGPQGEAVIPEKTERFAVREATLKERADWYSRTLSFTPTVAGPHTLQIKLLTSGIPKIHVMVSDPLKKDGKRMPGY